MIEKLDRNYFDVVEKLDNYATEWLYIKKKKKK